MCEDNMLFSHVKISRFRAKAHRYFTGVYITNYLMIIQRDLSQVIFKNVSVNGSYKAAQFLLPHMMKWSKSMSMEETEVFTPLA